MRKPDWQQFALATIVTIFVLLCGWFSQRFSSAGDVTANNRHSLTLQTQNTLAALSEPVSILAVLGPEQAPRDAVTELVGRYQVLQPNITLEFINPETQPGRARELNITNGGELIVKNTQREQRLRRLSERALSNAMRQLNRDGDRQIMFITGHEERTPDGQGNGDWQLGTTQLAQIGLISDTISLVTTPRIDSHADLLVIAAPRRPYFPGEIASVLQYIGAGGNLLWIIEHSNKADGGLNLNALSLEFGVDVLPGKVIDTASQRLNTGAPSVVVLDRHTKHPINGNLTSPVILPGSKALAITPLAGQTTLPLLLTPESSWTETGALQGEVRFDESTDEVAGPLTLGVTIERQFGDNTQRIAILGDADFASNQFVGNGSNQAFLESLVLWLAGDDKALEFVTQAAPDTQLSLSNKAIVILSSVFLLGLPLLMLCIAAWLAFRRRRD
ncbi:MAG: Gldg family protein [Granulosicoccaceae bacterium]